MQECPQATPKKLDLPVHFRPDVPQGQKIEVIVDALGKTPNDDACAIYSADARYSSDRPMYGKVPYRRIRAISIPPKD